MAAKYDLVVLGAGPAGEKGAAQAAYFGKRVAVVDPSPRPGGIAVSTAGIPRAMPVYGYEIDANDIPPYAPGAAGTAQGASHVGAWYLNPVSPALDANQQALQDEEVASVTHFAATGNPNANGTPYWPEFGRSGSEMVLAPAGDSAAMSIGQVMAVHNCGFWDSIAPAGT